jgi:hypothetical protein
MRRKYVERGISNITIQPTNGLLSEKRMPIDVVHAS